MKAFAIGLAVIAALSGLTACDTTPKTLVTHKDGAVNPALCSGDTPYILRTKTGKAGEVIVCVNEQTFNKYGIGYTYP